MDPTATLVLLSLFSASAWCMALGVGMYLFVCGWLRGAGVLVLASFAIALLQGRLGLAAVSLSAVTLLLVLVFLKAAAGPCEDIRSGDF